MNYNLSYVAALAAALLVACGPGAAREQMSAVPAPQEAAKPEAARPGAERGEAAKAELARAARASASEQRHVDAALPASDHSADLWRAPFGE